MPSHDPRPSAALAASLLNPRRIALIGASGDLAKTASRPLRYLRTAGFEGQVYAVNPTRSQVQGEPAFASVSALPERPDHAFVLTPTEQAIEDVAECARLGVPVVTVLASGFSESGAQGRAREQRLADIAARHGTRILGPASLGLVNVRRRLVLTANAAFAESGLPVGGTFCVSQSGSLIGALTSRGKARGIGFHSLVSVGTEIDLSVGEICECALDEPDVTGYLLFLESMRHADRLHAFARAAAQRGKPVVVYKLGRSQAAAELTQSHTGALAGEDAVASAFFRDAGIARVQTLDGLLEALPLLARMPAQRAAGRGRVGVVTTTGGGAAMAVDQLGVRGLDVVAPSAQTLQRLAERGISNASGRIVDLTLAGVRYEVMHGALAVLQSAPEFDLVLAVVGSSARTQPDLAVKPVIDSADAGLPLACFIVPEAPEALARLAEAGVPAFRTPESCADAIAAAFARTAPGPRRRLAAPMAASRLLDEAAAYQVLARVGVPHAPVELLDAQAAPAASSFTGPVVVKVLDAAIAHKSDVGGVVMKVDPRTGVPDAIARIRQSVEAAIGGFTLRRVLVQPMVAGVGEVLVGMRRDPDMGAFVVLAAGGLLAEIHADRAIRLAPVTLAAAHDMIGEVRSLRALAGYRGQAAGDLDALAAAIVAMSNLCELDDPAVIEAEVNPLMVMPQGHGVVAVDALVRVA